MQPEDLVDPKLFVISLNSALGYRSNLPDTLLNGKIETNGHRYGRLTLNNKKAIVR